MRNAVCAKILLLPSNSFTLLKFYQNRYSRSWSWVFKPVSVEVFLKEERTPLKNEKNLKIQKMFG